MSTQQPTRARARSNNKLSVHDRMQARIAREAKFNAKSIADSTTEKPIQLIHLIPAAARLGVSPWTVRHWIAADKVRYHRLGRRVYLSETEITRLRGVELGGLSTNANY